MATKKSKSEKKDKKPREQKKPGGLIAFAVIHLVIYCISLISLLINLGLGNFSKMAQLTRYTETYLIISTIISLILAIFAITSAIGILSLKEWARIMIKTAAIATIAIGFLSAIYSIIIFSGTNLGLILIISSLIGFVISCTYQGLVIWYFSKKEIKKICS